LSTLGRKKSIFTLSRKAGSRAAAVVQEKQSEPAVVATTATESIATATATVVVDAEKKVEEIVNATTTTVTENVVEPARKKTRAVASEGTTSKAQKRMSVLDFFNKPEVPVTTVTATDDVPQTEIGEPESTAIKAPAADETAIPAIPAPAPTSPSAITKTLSSIGTSIKRFATLKRTRTTDQLKSETTTAEPAVASEVVAEVSREIPVEPTSQVIDSVENMEESKAEAEAVVETVVAKAAEIISVPSIIETAHEESLDVVETEIPAVPAKPYLDLSSVSAPVPGFDEPSALPPRIIRPIKAWEFAEMDEGISGVFLARV
jgi:hypothetical protein